VFLRRKIFVFYASNPSVVVVGGGVLQGLLGYGEFGG
jgi:hypothetical protein